METISSLNPQDLISVHGAELRTDTRKVAQVFNKRHQHLMQRIATLEYGEQFLTANFSAVKFCHLGNEYDASEMTKDGFMLLVMGFTGKKAMAIKVAYIEAFNTMAAQLMQLPEPQPAQADKKKPLNPVKLSFYIPPTTLTLDRNAITQLNALFGTVEFLNEDFWPKIRALFPLLGKEYRSAFETADLLLHLLKTQRAECEKVSASPI